MKVSELRRWLFISRSKTGNPAGSIWLVTASWRDDAHTCVSEEVVIGWWGEALVLNVGGELFYTPVKVGDWKVKPDGSMEHWGLEKLAPGVWALRPSIVKDQSLHAFVVFTGAPEPAPWETAGLKEALESAERAGLLKLKEPALHPAIEPECACDEIQDGRGDRIRHGESDPRHEETSSSQTKTTK